MSKTEIEFQRNALRDPRLAVHAASSHAAWLWAVDGSRVIWCNAMAAAALGRTTPDALVAPLDPADQHRRQVMHLAGRLPQGDKIRLERLRGFGAPLGRMATMACCRLPNPDGGNAVLMVSTDSFARPQPFAERLRFLVAGIAAPAAAFTSTGTLVVRNDGAAAALGSAQTLSDLGLESVREDALRDGRIEMPARFGRFVLYRVGAGAETAIVAVLTPMPAFDVADPTAAPAAIPAKPALPASPVLPAAGMDEAFADEVLVEEDPPYQPGPAATTAADAIVDEAFADEVLVDEDRPDGAPSDLHRVEPVVVEAAAAAPAPTPSAPAGPTLVESTPAEPTPAEPSPAEPSPAAEAQGATVPLDEALADEVLVEELPDDTTSVEVESLQSASTAASQPEASVAVASSSTPDISAAETMVPTVPAIAPASDAPPLPASDPAPAPRRHPLRFMWQMNAENRFSLGSDEFTRLVGPLTSAALGRPWQEIVDTLGIDPEGRVARAVATHDTWSGVVVDWPMDGSGHRLPVELSGLPIFDRDRNFLGYRGFGVCRDLDGLDRLEDIRRRQGLFATASTLSAAASQPAARASDPTATANPSCAGRAESPDVRPQDDVKHDLQHRPPDTIDSAAQAAATADAAMPSPEPSSPLVDTPQNISADAPKNVLPFRPAADPKAGDNKTPALSPVENHTFAEIARQLSARLERQAPHQTGATPFEPLAREISEDSEATDLQEVVELEDTVGLPHAADTQQINGDEQPAWLSSISSPPQGSSQHDQPLLDRMPVGVLIYRLDRLIYANAAFLQRTGFDTLHMLSEAGGLDALFVKAHASVGSSTSESGTPLSVTSPRGDQQPGNARLFSIDWDNEPAMALIFESAPVVEATPAAESEPSTEPHDAGVAAADVMSTEAEPAPVQDDFSAIFTNASDGVLLFERSGTVMFSNPSADRLFGYAAGTFAGENLADLFAPESQQVVLDYFESLDRNADLSPSDHGRDVRARTRSGETLQLSMTMGRTGSDNQRFFAVFRDISQLRRHEAELLSTRQRADRATSARTASLAKISHEIRAPLNAIIGFADVMIEQRFGPLGNERYVEYMKDIRASGERVIAIMNDMLDLSRIESGKLDLKLADQNLNEIVEQCVGILQPRANRERIIIRTSLAHALPPVVADAASLRQIATNLIADSIGLANAGGQVIVSTASTDDGSIVLKIRDTGHGLSETDIATATDPFRIDTSPDPVVSENGINLSLTKALVEANRAQFHVRSAAQSGTLIEVIFPPASSGGR